MHRRHLPAFLLCLLGGSVICLICWWVSGSHEKSHPGSLPVTILSRAGQGASTPAVAGLAQTRPDRIDEPVDAADVALEKLRQDAKAGRRQEKKDAKFWAAFAVKYTDKNLKAPGNLDEAAVAMGSWMAEVARLKAKWGKKVPPAGTPEASEYQQDQEKLMTCHGFVGQVRRGPEGTWACSPTRTIMAQFQTLSLSGGLNLNEGQMLTRSTRHYLTACEEADARVLEHPKTGSKRVLPLETKLRTELGRRASTEVNALRSPAQSASGSPIFMPDTHRCGQKKMVCLRFGDALIRAVTFSVVHAELGRVSDRWVWVPSCFGFAVTDCKMIGSSPVRCVGRYSNQSNHARAILA